MATKTEGEWFVANESFTTEDGLAYHKNISRVRRTEAVYKKFPHLFNPIESSATPPDVEQATAAPGEKRAAEPAKKSGGMTTASVKGS